MGLFKTFYLPPHHKLDLKFRIFFSSQTDVQISTTLDDYYFQTHDTCAYYELCDTILFSCDKIYDYSIRHQSSTLQVQVFLVDYPNYLATNIFWGITDVFLSVYQCPPQCEVCINSITCLNLTQFSVYFWEQDISKIEGWQKRNLPFRGTHKCGNFQFYGPFHEFDVIKFNSIILQDHTQIMIRFKLIIVQLQRRRSLEILVNNKQQNHNYHFALDSIDKMFICGQSQVIADIQAQYQHYVPNLSIEISIPDMIDWGAYFGIRDFEIFTDAQKVTELCNDHNINPFDGCFNFQFDCSEGCSNCVQGNCLECYSNWQHDLYNNDCIPKCGDGIIVGIEECDDSNLIPNDGCHECQFSCPLNCLQCQFGSCLNCNSLFQLVNNNCIPDILNYKNKQQLECIECENTHCMKCMPEWNLFNFQCVQCEADDCYFYEAICGDGKVEDLEECDDGNTILFDGCYECQYQCEYSCIECVEGVCLKFSDLKDIKIIECDFGFHLIDQNCHSNCGDQIVVSDEKCDDGNNEPFDGCFQCQYSCSLYCQDCYEGYCLACDIGYQLQNNRCYELCGDGIKLTNEECDDGNILSLDGCSEKCQIEDLWKCSTQDQERSLCFQFDNPALQLQYINMTFTKQYILMTSSQLVKQRDSNVNLTSNLQTSIVNVNQFDYIITFESQVEPTYEELKDIQYLFTIELLNQLEVDLIFNVSFNISLVNSYDLEIMNKELKLKLKNPIVLNEQQKQASQKASKFNLMIFIILGISSFIILLSGNPSDCFEVLDTLQYQSYLRYINVAFPENISIYFESSELLSIQPFLITFNLLEVFQSAFDQEILDSFGKFYFYSINADLLINFQSQFCQIAFLTLLTILYYGYVKINYKSCISQRQIIDLRREHSMFISHIVLILYQIHQFILRLGKMFSLSGLKLWILANSWDILFKIILYLYSKPQNSLRTQLSIPLCIGIMITLFAIAISYTINNANNKKLRDLKMYRHHGLIVIKKFLFLFFLIKAQDNSIIQCIAMALINTLYLGLIIITNLLKDNIDKIVIFWFEMPIIIFTFSSVSFHPDFAKHLTNNQQILIGFAQIMILSFGLLSPLIKYGYVIIEKAQSTIIIKCQRIPCLKNTKKGHRKG
ncbi:unnamed protein product, partial (macronuclear) [Paramecium tetraurelia]